MPGIENSVLNIFHLEHNDVPDSRDYQEFKLFLKDERIKELIPALRKERNIDPNDIRTRLQGYADLLDAEEIVMDQAVQEAAGKGLVNNPIELFNIQEKYGHPELTKKSNAYICDLHRYVNSRITIKDIEKILIEFNKPFSWADSLSGYILTAVIRAPHDPYEIRCIPGGGVELKNFPGINWPIYLKAIKTVGEFKSLGEKGNCIIRSENNAVILRISGKMKVTTLRGKYKEINALLLNLCGSEIKNKRKKKLDEHLTVAMRQEWLKSVVPRHYEKKSYEDPATGKIQKHPKRSMEKEKLINARLKLKKVHDPKDEDREKEDATMRQIHKRNKFRLNKNVCT